MVKFTENQQKYILKFFKKKSARRIARDIGVSREEVVSFMTSNTLKDAARRPILDIRSRAYHIFLPIAVILFTSLLCYFRLIARNAHGNFTHIIKWDVVDYTYPMLIFISDSLKSFIFPLWNPYQYSGAPCALNPSTIAYNPMCLFVIFFKGYSLELLQFHTFLVFFIAGLSMYACLRSFSLSKTSSLVGAISFMSCGFFVAGAEYFTLINMLAFLPVCLMFLNRLLDRLDFRSLGWGAFAIAILTFYGHPTMLVSFMYLLFLFGILKIFFIDEHRQRNLISRKVLYLLGFFALGLLAAAVLLIPGVELAALSTRSGGVSLEKIKIDSLRLCHLSTMWYPFLALGDFPSAHLDIALRNCSIGILGLFFSMYYIFFGKTRLKWSLLILLSISLTMAFGDNIASYKLLIKVVPLIKHFRHPAVDYRAIFLFLLCLCTGLGVEEMRQSTGRCFKNVLITCFVFLSAALLMSWYIKSVYNIDLAVLIVKNYQFLLVSALLLSIIVALSANMSKKWFCAMLIVFCIIDVSHWAKINFFTVASPVENGVWVNIKNAESKRNFKVDNNATFTRRAGSYPISLQDNFAAFFKYFTDTGYEPLILRYYDEIINSPARGIVTEDFRILPVYETRLLPDKKSVLSGINHGADLHKIALINKQDIKGAALLEKLKGVSFKENNNFSARIIHYDPNSIYYEIDTAQPTVIFFNEIYYPGWHLFSSGKELPLFKINHAFRGTYLEAGSYDLKMIFSPFSFKMGFIISLCSFLFIFFNIFRYRKSKQ